MRYPKPERRPKGRTRRKAQNKLYSEVVKPTFLAGLAAGQRRLVALCQVCLDRQASEVHHKAGRVGHDLIAPTNLMGVCRECHARVHSDPAWAYAQGFLTKRSGWQADGDEQLADVAEDGA